MSEAAVESELQISSAEPTPRISPWLCLAIGAGAAIIGLLPWLATGIRLPLQNLWATDTLPDGMPLALLPFSQYSLFTIFGLIVVGSAVAGITARALRPRLAPGGFWMILLGVLAVQVIALVQSAVAVGAGLQQRPESGFYLTALIAMSVLSILIGVLVLFLIARAPRAGALVGLAGAAIATGPWIGQILAPLWLTELIYSPLTQVARWVPPVLIGIAIAWAGVNTVGRVIAALFSLALLWFAPAAITGISSAAGTRVLAKDIPGMIEYGLGVFRMALFIPELALPPLVVAVVVAAIGLVVRYVVGARRAASRWDTPAP